MNSLCLCFSHGKERIEWKEHTPRELNAHVKHCSFAVLCCRFDVLSQSDCKIGVELWGKFQGACGMPSAVTRHYLAAMKNSSFSRSKYSMMLLII